MRLLYKKALYFLLELCCCYYFIREVDHYTAFDLPIKIIIGLLAIIIFIRIISNDRKEYLKSDKASSFILTFLVLTLVFGLFITLYRFSLRDVSPSQLYFVSKYSDFSGLSVDLRQDNTYKISSWSMGEDIYRGTYTINDSIIILKKLPAEVIESNKLVIREDGSINENGIKAKSIYPINKDGQVVGFLDGFEIIDK